MLVFVAVVVAAVVAVGRSKAQHEQHSMSTTQHITSTSASITISTPTTERMPIITQLNEAAERTTAGASCVEKSKKLPLFSKGESEEATSTHTHTHAPSPVSDS